MKLKQMVKDFEKLQNIHSKFGADDSEPSHAFHDMLVRAYKGLDWKTPDWQLYSSMKGSEEVANILTDRAKVLHDAINEAPHKEVVDLLDYYGL
jgi:hypothetical protein